MVRGATLELLDITYDGLEDPLTGYLTGGLGQLVDGKYGTENYRAVGENGIVRGETVTKEKFSQYYLNNQSFCLRYLVVEKIISLLEYLQSVTSHHEKLVSNN